MKGRDKDSGPLYGMFHGGVIVTSFVLLMLKLGIGGGEFNFSRFASHHQLTRYGRAAA